MSLVVSESSGNRVERELIPAGLQRAVCVQVIDLGSHLDTQYNKVKHEVRLTFELADVRADFEKDGVTQNLPRIIGRKYNMSLSERATLRQHLQSWRGKPFTADELKGFDIANLVGKACMINVDHFTSKSTGKPCAGVGGVLKLMTGTPAPQPEGESYFYSIEKHGRNYPDSMPDWIKEDIEASDEMSGNASVPASVDNPTASAPPPVVTPDVAEVDLSEDIPF